ncbi:MAG: hypothetical protein ACI8X3_002715, partial [Saprospiraceae bacterium]
MPTLTTSNYKSFPKSLRNLCLVFKSIISFQIRMKDFKTRFSFIHSIILFLKYIINNLLSFSKTSFYKRSLLFFMLFFFAGISYSQNGPCDATLYDFGGGQGNVVPCGPSANTTPKVPITPNLVNSGPNVDCSGAMPGDGGSPTDVLWVTFIIKEGGSFEWQTVPGPDDFYWKMFVSTTPNPDQGSTAGACNNLIELDCGIEFTGWRVESTPHPGFTWRFYIAFYLRGGDQAGSGVVKIRKSCGLSCESSTATATVTPDDVCINSGELVSLSATTDNPPASSYFWTETPDNNTLSSNTTQSPTASNITVTTTYSVAVVGADGCPAVDSVVVTVGGCCVAEVGTISGPGPFEVCGSNDLTGDFIVMGNAGAGYDFAFLLVDENGNIVASNLDGNFDFSGLPAGTYTVYGLSYSQANSPNNVTSYLS